MREVASKHPAGTVGVLVGPLSRYRALYTSLEKLKVPEGTALVFEEGIDVARNCNKLVEQHMTGDWLWLMGDDHRFGPDILMALLDRKVEIVAPVVGQRGEPFRPVCYKRAVPMGKDNQMYTWEMLGAEHPNGGLIEVDAAGSAGMLIRKWVFDALPKPWFAYTPFTSEDIGFCVNARAGGYKIHVDLDHTMSHITPCDLEPTRNAEGKWHVAVNVDGRRTPMVFA